MKKFVLYSAVYVLLGLVFVAIGEFYLWRFKESVSIVKVAEIQSSSKKELYYGRQILGNSLSTYKFEMFLRKQPNVLVLGQSVTLQFRDFMFEPYQEDFYNAGLMVRNLEDLKYVVELFKNKRVRKPSLIVLGVDFSFVLKENALDQLYSIKDLPEDRATNVQSHFKGYQQVFLNGSLREIPKVDVGFGKAGMIGRGYRNDGSYRHKPEIEQYVLDATYYDGGLRERLKANESPFLANMQFDQRKAAEYFKVLAQLKLLGIELLLYVPPYSDQFFNLAKQHKGFGAFWPKFMAFQEELVNKNYDVIRFTTPSQMGLKDDYMVDAEHPGEVLCGIQLLCFVKESGTPNKMLKTLTFSTLQHLLDAEQTLPISFLRDSVSVPLRNNLPLKN